MAEIKLEQLTKIYPDGTKAVEALDLEIADGEFVVLVGPSGCGKTSALRMVAGLEDITAGKVWIGGRVVNKMPPKDRDIAMIFQNYALYPHMTAAGNMGFALRMRKLPKGQIRTRVTDAAGVLGLMQTLNKRPRTLSGGQRQRVAMGRAIVREPQAFLMDEPLSNLDAKLRVEMRAEIARIQRDLRATTIYVTHDQVEAMTLGDRVVVMRDGFLQQVGSPCAARTCRPPSALTRWRRRATRRAERAASSRRASHASRGFARASRSSSRSRPRGSTSSRSRPATRSEGRGPRRDQGRQNKKC